MTKQLYFLLCVDKKLYINKDWLLSIFSIMRNDINKPFYPIRGEKKYYYLNEDFETVEISDSDSSRPLFNIREKLSLNKGDIKNLTEDIETNYGIAIANVVGLVHPLGDKINYVNGEFNIDKIEAEIYTRLTTDDKYRDVKDFKSKDPIYVSEYLDFIDSITSLTSLTQITVPSATEKTLMTDPNIVKRRDELLEQYKDQLNDPAIIAKIEGELISLDKNFIKGDLSEGFYFKGKSYDIVRKKTHLMMGYESGFGLKADTITSSLSEGWDTAKMPGMVNSLREGSYGRGKMTGEGGYANKLVIRVMQNASIKEEDCGTKLGWDKQVTEKNHKDFISFYYLTPKGDELIGQDNVRSLIGRNVKLRTPQLCKTENGKFCKHCLGEANSLLETGLASLASDITSKLMDLAMASAHAVALKTSPYDIEDAII